MELTTRDYTGVTTEQIAQEMLTEPTGTHFLDSGGAYGRNWQRNQGRDFSTQAPAWAEFSVSAKDGKPGRLHISATRSLYHWMVDCLEFDPAMQARLDEFAEENPNTPWLLLADEFVDMFKDKISPDAEPEVENTYNFPDYCDLSQTVQYIKLFQDGSYEASHLILSVHGGCDVRSGYSAPRCFRIKEELWVEQMRVQCIGAGEETWWWQDWCSIEASSMNSCLEPVHELPAFAMDQVMELVDGGAVSAALLRAGRDRAALAGTTLTEAQRLEASRQIDAAVSDLTEEAMDGAVRLLAQEHEWFLVGTGTDVWLFHEDDQCFADGRQLQVYVD